MKELLMVIEAHDFASKDFVGGEVALDFINTVTGRDQTPRDWLDGYPRLLEWASRAELLPETELGVLGKVAQTSPDAASKALQRAKRLREALFAIFTGMISGDAPPEIAMALLNQYWQKGVAAHELNYGKHDVRLELRSSAVDLDLIPALIAYRFVENVLPESRDRLRICAGNNCSWLFLDRSKAGRRRWCDMAVCGNAAKSRRFYARATGRKAK
ncbi:CGNR zinc finger domain-containing protein [Rhodanobacter koreensis]